MQRMKELKRLPSIHCFFHRETKSSVALMQRSTVAELGRCFLLAWLSKHSESCISWWFKVCALSMIISNSTHVAILLIRLWIVFRVYNLFCHFVVVHEGHPTSIIRFYATYDVPLQLKCSHTFIYWYVLLDVIWNWISWVVRFKTTELRLLRFSFKVDYIRWFVCYPDCEWYESDFEQNAAMPQC